MLYPEKLREIISLFEHLSEIEKRENLILFAEQADSFQPDESVRYDLEDIRHDQECTDTVGLFLKVDVEGRVTFRVLLGPHVQTLTKAMTSILCQGLEGATLGEILNVSQDFVPKIVGAQLVRARSQTVYYILTRMKSACKVYQNQLRSRELGR